MPRSRTRNAAYTYSSEVWEVLRVDGWRLNMTTHELEWEVVWVGGQTSWEPNCNAGGYTRSIFEFLSEASELPQQH